MEDDGVGLEGHIEYTVAQREVDARGGHDELEEEHPDRPGEHAHGELVQVRGLELVRRHDVGFRVELADLLGPPDEEDRAVRLGQEEQRDHGQARVDEADPERPPPANCWGAEAGYDGGEERAEDGGLVMGFQLLSAKDGRADGEDVVGAYRKKGCHGSSSRAIFAVDVCHDACYQRNRRACEHADQQPENKESRPVRRQRTSQCPYTEHDKGSDDEPPSAELFGQWRPDDWT